jgi:uncharacterized membrane protein YfhO
LRRVGVTFSSSIPSDISFNYNSDDLINIQKIKNSTSHLTYKIESLSNQLIVFSEIYYPSGWKVYLNGIETSYFDMNYLLRAMEVPAGVNQVDFYFSPEIVKTGINVRLFTIIITFSLIAYMVYKKNKWVL